MNANIVHAHTPTCIVIYNPHATFIFSFHFQCDEIVLMDIDSKSDSFNVEIICWSQNWLFCVRSCNVICAARLFYFSRFVHLFSVVLPEKFVLNKRLYRRPYQPTAITNQSKKRNNGQSWKKVAHTDTHTRKKWEKESMWEREREGLCSELQQQ